MSAVEELNEVPDGSINPLNVRNELVRYMTTAVNYVLRQGLSGAEVQQVVENAVNERAIAIAKTSLTKHILPVPELLDKGINDMREKGAN